jgi:hypothetical protein
MMSAGTIGQGDIAAAKARRQLARQKNIFNGAMASAAWRWVRQATGGNVLGSLLSPSAQPIQSRWPRNTWAYGGRIARRRRWRSEFFPIN